MIIESQTHISVCVETLKNEKYKVNSTELEDDEYRILMGVTTENKPIMFYITEDILNKLPDNIKEKVKRV